ncbi:MULTISPECIES: hypothetical protein [Paraburkholderia]|uniref:Porin n=2 Tax=Paraburkholderia TaxID=1822464 RepID=A0ABU9SDG9_9BURK
MIGGPQIDNAERETSASVGIQFGANQKKMGETPIFSLSQVVAPGARITAQKNSRTPSDFVILAFFAH